ncbi:putative ribonuclease H-like domain-containing protein [Tanacetum coccineum]|uniref:Ribonuclease H-like domain-containing protein n=1 Tax=Tanacetum coccineum TaxID=301880 RepID=A0ABQ4YUS5_9ASTR
MSTEVKGSTLKQSTAEPTNIPKGYTQAASSKVCYDNQQDKEVYEGRQDDPLTSSRRMGLPLIKNRANGRKEKKTVAIEDSNSKALVATDNNEDIDWTKEFDAEQTWAFSDKEGTRYDFDIEAIKMIYTSISSFNGYKLRGFKGNKTVRNNIQRSEPRIFSRETLGTAHQRKGSFIPSAVLTRDGLISTARPKVTQTVPSKSTANDGYHPRMDNIRPRTSSFSPSSRSSTTRTPHRPQRPKKIVKSIWVKKGSTVGSQAVLPQTVKKNAMINPKQTWRPKGNYLDSVNRDNGSYTLKQFEYGNPEEDLKDYAIIDSGCSGSMTGDKDKLSDFKEFKGGYVAFGNNSKAQNKPSEERTADKEVPLSSEEQVLHDELVSLMHQESLAKLHNDAQRNAFEEEKKRIALDKGKECVDSTFTLSTANTPPQSTGNTPTDSDDDIPKDGVFSTNSFDAEEGGVADYNNMDPTIDVPSTPTLRIHKIHPQSQIIGKSTAGVQTRRKLQDSTSNQHQALLSFIYKQNRTNHKDQQTCLFACFLSQEEPKKVSQALADESWVEAMQEELLQFKLQEVWVLCDLPEGKRVIGTKWVFRNKRDERGTIIKNKARLVAQGYRQEEGVDYDEVFAPVARIEAIRLFLAFASFMGFIVYQMDVKSAFLYGNITEEVYVKQPPGFEDPAHPNKVYRVVKALYGLHQAPRAWYERLSTFLLKHGYRRGAIDKTLFIKKDRRDIMLVQVYVDDIIFGSTKSSMVKDFEDLMQKEFKMSSMGELTFFLGLQVKQTSAGIFLSQDKYVKDILNKFDFRTIKPASTPIEAHKSLGKDEEGEDVDVHLYRSMIGCLMYLTASRPDIMFAVCLCARFQVTPKVSHLHAVKRIFRYLKHQPKLGLWYPKDSPFHLEAFSDSDYAGDNHDRRSTSGGCQYLGRRLVSWQCKKQTIVAISSTEAEYVAAASCCAQVLWMQNQLLDYGFNFMNTEIHIDNESTICIVKNPVFHSKTKHIQIRHHFIRDCYEQRLINVVKVHTDDNVADLLTKGFDLARFNFLVVTIGTDNYQGTAEVTSTAKYKMRLTTSGGDEGLLDIICFNWKFRRLKKQNPFSSKLDSQAQGQTQDPVQSGRTSGQTSRFLGRKKEGTLADEPLSFSDYTKQIPFFEDIVDKDAAVTPDLERKSDGTEEINIEEKKALMTLNFEDEAGPSSPICPPQIIEPEEQFKVDEVLV